ncbi:MAG: hypothetical protein ABWY29_09090 [Blastococcus sp.]
MTSSHPPQPPSGGQPPEPGQPPYGQQPPAANPYAQPAGSGGSSTFDLKKLRMADYVIAGGTLLYLVLALFPWVDFGDYFGVDLPDDSVNGFGAAGGLVTFTLLLFLLATVWAALPAVTQLGLGFPRGWVTVGLTGLGLLLTLFAWIRTLSYGFEIAPLLALLTAAGMTLFAVLALLPELRNRPALPGGLANAAQWANQPAPGQQGGQTGQPYGQQPTYGQPGTTRQYGAPQQYEPPQPYGAPQPYETPPPPPPPPPPPGTPWTQPPAGGPTGYGPGPGGSA